MKILDAPKVKELTTMRLGGKAIALVIPENRDDVENLGTTLQRLGGIVFPLGRGSNIIADDRELPYTLVKAPPYNAPTVTKNAGDTVYVQADASMPLPRLIGWASKHGLGNLTPLTGIPGEVGGALRMNAGSFGGSFGDYLVGAELFTPQHGIYSASRAEIVPTYRHTVLPHDDENPLILSVTLALTPMDSGKLYYLSKETMKKKLATQPVYANSAGCVFANPDTIPAGRLLDELGFRGRSSGGMSFSFVHANFLVNTVYGKSAQAFSLIQEAKEAALQQRGIDLRLEVKILSW